VQDSGGSRVVVVQSTAIGTSGASSTVAFAATQAGDALIVGVGLDANASPLPSVASITDDKRNAYFSSGFRAVDPTSGCGDAAELWYAPDVAAGTTSITLNFTAMTLNEVWVMEVSGLSTSAPFVTGAATANPPPSGTIATSPQVAASAGNLVVCVYTACNDSSGLHSGSPFIDLAEENTEFTAYYIPPAAGTYGAAWDQVRGTYNIVTGVFH
jgi:hypothetical protein